MSRFVDRCNVSSLAIRFLAIFGVCLSLACGNGVKSTDNPGVVQNSQPGTPSVDRPPENNSGENKTGTSGNKPDVPNDPKSGTNLAFSRDVEFMGSRAKGNRICIIADKSQSMAAKFKLKDVDPKSGAKGGRAIDYLKEELHKTLKQLSPDQEFMIFLFDAKPEAMPGGTWLKGTEAEKVTSWIDGITMKLGTVPLPAFKMAFKLEPKPDVIFFMTDGGFTNILDELDKLNQSTPKVVINTIQLQASATKVVAKVNQLQEIAARSGGTFTVISPATLEKQ